MSMIAFLRSALVEFITAPEGWAKKSEEMGYFGYVSEVDRNWVRRS